MQSTQKSSYESDTSLYYSFDVLETFLKKIWKHKHWLLNYADSNTVTKVLPWGGSEASQLNILANENLSAQAFLKLTVAATFYMHVDTNATCLNRAVGGEIFDLLQGSHSSILQIKSNLIKCKWSKIVTVACLKQFNVSNACHLTPF